MKRTATGIVVQNNYFVSSSNGLTISVPITFDLHCSFHFFISFLEALLRIPYTFKGRFFCKKKGQIKRYLSNFILKILKRARVINKNVFSHEILLPARVL